MEQRVVPALLPGVGPDATVLFIHAHPDDETLVTGATMAAYAAAGARVVLLTCTRGELGEVIPPALAHLEHGAAARPGSALFGRHDVVAAAPPEATVGAGLAAERERELAGALAALGVREHVWLGQGPTAPASGPMTFRDSGMRWGPDGRAVPARTVLPGSLSQAPLPLLAGLLAQLLRDLRPDAVVSYAADGGYGHPDHIRTHELTLAGIALAADPADGAAGYAVPALFTIVSDRPERPLDEGAARITLTGLLPAKLAAMAAHRTQITVTGQRYALSDEVWHTASAVEEFVQLLPTPGPEARA